MRALKKLFSIFSSQESVAAKENVEQDVQQISASKAPANVNATPEFLLLSCLPQPFNLKQARLALGSNSMEHILAPYMTSDGWYNLQTPSARVPDATMVQFLTNICECFYEPNDVEYAEQMPYHVIVHAQKIEKVVSTLVTNVQKAKLLTMAARSGKEMHHHDMIKALAREAINIFSAENLTYEKAQAVAMHVLCCSCTTITQEIQNEVNAALNSLSEMPDYDRVKFMVICAKFTMLHFMGDNAGAAVLVNNLLKSVSGHVPTDLYCILLISRIRLCYCLQKPDDAEEALYQILKEGSSYLKMFIGPDYAFFKFHKEKNLDVQLQYAEQSIIEVRNYKKYDNFGHMQYILSMASYMCSLDHAYDKALEYSTRITTFYTHAKCNLCYLNSLCANIDYAIKIDKHKEVISTLDVLLRDGLGLSYDSSILDILYEKIKVLHDKTDIPLLQAALAKHLGLSKHNTEVKAKLLRPLIYAMTVTKATKEIENLLFTYCKSKEFLEDVSKALKSYPEVIPVQQYRIQRQLAVSSDEVKALPLREEMASYAVCHDSKVCKEQTEKIIQIVEAKGVPDDLRFTYMTNLHRNAWANYYEQNPKATIASIEKAMARYTTWSAIVRVLFHRLYGCCYIMQGNGNDAHAYLQQALEIAEETAAKDTKIASHIPLIQFEIAHAFFVSNDFASFASHMYTLGVDEKEIFAKYDKSFDNTQFLNTYIKKTVGTFCCHFSQLS